MASKSREVIKIFLGYITLVCLLRDSDALTGLCQTEMGRATCYACSGVSGISYPITELQMPPRDCCGDPYVYSMCEQCIFNPDSCGLITVDSNRNNNHVNRQFNDVNRPKADDQSNDMSRFMQDMPEKRAKYFLGKRANVGAFLGKRDNLPFLGKRHIPKPFLGKRSDLDLNEFDLEEAVGNELHNIAHQTNKRPNPFLGKRINNAVFNNEPNDVSHDLESLNAGAYLDENEVGVEADDKRSNPFLGKRYQQSKKSNPFLGKRNDGGDDDDNDIIPLELTEDDEIIKRSNPFLGKRSSKYFLGKRSNQPTVEELKNLYMRPLSRRAKYFLGKRSQVENSPLPLLQSKRQKYFLGKRNVPESVGEDERSFVNNANDLLIQEQMDTVQDKRQKYFLGKRSTDASLHAHAQADDA